MIAFKTQLTAVAILLAVSLAPQSSAYAQSSEDLFSTFGQTEISCYTLIVAGFGGKLDVSHADATPVRFDIDACKKLFQPTTIGTLAKPGREFFAKGAALTAAQSAPYENEASEAALSKLRLELEALPFAEIQQALMRSVEPITALCMALQTVPAIKAGRTCIFGMPKGKSVEPLLNAFFFGGLTGSESVCKRFGVAVEPRVTPEFAGFLDGGGRLGSWESTRKELLANGFQCPDKGSDAGCGKLFLQVTAGKDDAGQMYTVVFPRLLSVYTGKWQAIGPGPHIGPNCPSAKQSDAFDPAPCPASPARGDDSGLCAMGEDWHTWYGMAALFNKISE
jgi:hypothetical protein